MKFCKSYLKYYYSFGFFLELKHLHFYQYFLYKMFKKVYPNNGGLMMKETNVKCNVENCKHNECNCCNLEELDFEKYRDEGGYDEEGQKRFQSRCITVQQLLASGYTRSQIKHLYKLIMADFSSEKIMSMFPRKTTVEQIDNLSKIF